MDKVLREANCDYDIALTWCVNAKILLQNVHGFSPYQLATGRNPTLPSFLHDKPPALINTLYVAHKAFTESERSERLHRALHNNTHTNSDIVHLNGDLVYYKRCDHLKWKGPATVLGKVGQQVLLKHGGYYICVHPCRLRLVEETCIKGTYFCKGVKTAIFRIRQRR